MGSLRHLPRTALTYVVGFLATLAASVAVLVIAHTRPDSRSIDTVARIWSRCWLWVAEVSLDVSGSEQVDAERSYVVVANHSSALDIMACFLAVPIPIRYLAKKELFRIPILASAMRAIGIVEVDRRARGSVHEQINTQVAALVASERSVIVYPEGTRNGELASFKKGAFTLAVGAQLPILPVTIHGSHEAWPPRSAWVRGGKVTVVIDPPIPTEGLTQADTNRLRDMAHDLIELRLKEIAAQS